MNATNSAIAEAPESAGLSPTDLAELVQAVVTLSGHLLEVAEEKKGPTDLVADIRQAHESARNLLELVQEAAAVADTAGPGDAWSEKLGRLRHDLGNGLNQVCGLCQLLMLHAEAKRIGGFLQDVEKIYELCRNFGNQLTSFRPCPALKTGASASSLKKTGQSEEVFLPQESLPGNEAALQVILQAIPVAVAITRVSDGQLLYGNKHLWATFGLAEEGGVNLKSPKAYGDPEDREKLFAALEKNNHLSNYEVQLKKTDGTPLWASVSAEFLTFEGEPAVFAAFQDITERKQRDEELERRVRERTAELETARDGALAADRAKNAFLANVSHELRNPLNHITGYCELLEQAVAQKGHEDLLEDLKDIRRSADNLVKLVDNILSLTKMGAPNIHLEARDIQVKEFVHQLAQSLSGEAEKKGNRLEVRCDERAGWMCTDPDRLRQILSNLLGNACKFTESGRITLRVQRETHPNRDWLLLAVSDTGIGMTAEEMSRVFEPFQQANLEIGRKYGGTGLGLTLSQDYCRAMGGRISVTSESGRGSTFTVHLPVVLPAKATQIAPSAQATQMAPPLPGSSPSGDLILVIDDDPNIHILMKRFVGAKGFPIRSARSGLEGLNLAKELRPAAITLDVLMPDLNGWEVLRLLKGEEKTAVIPVIMLTVVDDKTKAYELGASEFLTKPVEWSQMPAIVGKYCVLSPQRSQKKR